MYTRTIYTGLLVKLEKLFKIDDPVKISVFNRATNAV